MGKRQDRIEKFCRAYIIELNATSAAKSAGYSQKTAKQQGSRLLTNVDVKARIAELTQKQLAKLDCSVDATITEIHRLAKSNILDYGRIDDEGQFNVDLSALSREQAASIQEIRVDTTGGTGDGERRQVLRTTFKLADKSKALDMLMRHHGQYNDKLHLSGLEGLADKINRIRTRKNA